jgi:predicted TIM-barrel fold metal-dependent hydrolase
MASSIPLIISVDDHVVEPPDLWERWLPARFKERGPHVVRSGYHITDVNEGHGVQTMQSSGPQVDWWVYEDVKKLMLVTGHWNGDSRDDLAAQPISFEEMPASFYDPAERLKAMDINHTERSMCFPNAVPRFCGQTFSENSDRELGLACIRAYNDWMIEEWCGSSGGRLIPLCIIPLWDPFLAAEEVRRNAARGCRAIAFSELPSNLGLPSIHANRYWDPLFEACNETGTVVCMHIGSGSKMPTSSPDAPKCVRVALTNQNAMSAFADWLLSGTLMRFPNLKIAFSESQIGWIPFMLERIDNVFLKSKWAQCDPSVTELPSLQVPGRVYGCFFEDTFGIESRNAIGIDQITFEVDYPHQDSTFPHTLEYITPAIAGLTDDEIYKIVRGNAINMLGLPRELDAV